MQLVGAAREQAVRRALEEEKRRPRFELGILLEQLLVALLERAEMMLFFLGETMEHAAAARVLGDARRARVELEAAALGGNGDAQRVARKQQLARRAFFGRRPAGAARFAGPVDLDHALPRREAARGGHFFDQRLDVRAQELVRAVAALADQMKVPRMPVGVLEAEAAFAEVHLARDAGVDHPLQRAVDRGPADAMIFALDEVDEIVGAQVSLLAEEHVDDQVALAGPLGAGRPKLIEVGQGCGHDRQVQQFLAGRQVRECRRITCHSAYLVPA